jgi:transposase
VRLRLSPGQHHDITRAAHLIVGFMFCYLIADKAYDAATFLAAVQAQGGVPVIPPRACSARVGYDEHLYKERHLVECLINKLKQFRRVATRYDKTDLSYVSMICLAAMTIWMR